MKRTAHLLRTLLVGLSNSAAAISGFDEHTRQALAMIGAPERLQLETIHYEFSVLAEHEVDLTTEPEIQQLAAQLERN